MSIRLNQYELNIEIIDIVKYIKQLLEANHINKLNIINDRHDNIQISCPIHKEGLEKKASATILKHDKITYNGKNIPAGTVHCFTCGYSTDIVGFIRDCLNISYKSAEQLLFNIANSKKLILNERNINPLLISNNRESIQYISKEELQNYAYIHKYMFQRKLTIDIINKFEVGYDPQTDCLTFPVYENGKCLFVAKRKIKYKQFIMPNINPKPIYGLDYITSKEVIICESVINALTCWVYGYQAIALFGTGSYYQLKVLQQSDIRSFILMFDGDLAGRSGADRFKSFIKDKFILDILLPIGKDVNDLSREEFKNLLTERNLIR